VVYVPNTLTYVVKAKLFVVHVKNWTNAEYAVHTFVKACRRKLRAAYLFLGAYTTYMPGVPITYMCVLKHSKDVRI